MFLQSGAMRGVLATNGSNTEKEAGMHDQCTVMAFQFVYDIFNTEKAQNIGSTDLT